MGKKSLAIFSLFGTYTYSNITLISAIFIKNTKEK